MTRQMCHTVRDKFNKDRCTYTCPPALIEKYYLKNKNKIIKLTRANRDRQVDRYM